MIVHVIMAVWVIMMVVMVLGRGMVIMIMTTMMMGRQHCPIPTSPHRMVPHSHHQGHLKSALVTISLPIHHQWGWMVATKMVKMAQPHPFSVPAHHPSSLHSLPQVHQVYHRLKMVQLAQQLTTTQPPLTTTTTIAL